jgi:uncharacterized membrane protein (Fun14 family)
MNLFPDEKVVVEANDKIVTLTTHRICYEQKEWGKSQNINIMLEHITSSENRYTSNIFFLILGVIGLALGYVRFEVVLVGVLFLVLYFLSRKNVVYVSSPSSTIKINVNGMKRERVLEFIDRIEQTKHQRLMSLNKG